MEEIKRKDLEILFSKIDERLDRAIDIFVIGGVSAIVGYDIAKTTEDVDLDSPIEPNFNSIFEQEAKGLGLDLYLSNKGIFYPPDGYRERMEFLDFPNKKLRVFYLNQYDLAISKIDRGFQKDMDDIKAVHKKSPYQCQELIRIFNDEYIHVSAIGDPRTKKMSLLLLILELFGKAVMEESKAKIGF